MGQKIKVRVTSCNPVANPEKFGDNGTNYRFRVAVNNGYDKEGNKRETEFLNVVAFGNTGKYFCEPDAEGDQRVQKGKPYQLEGTLQLGSYENKEGVTIPTVQLILDNAVELALVRRKKAEAETAEAETADADVDDEPPFN